MVESTEPEDVFAPTRDLAAAYAELQNLLVERPDVTDFLHQVAVLAASVIPGSSCGITMRRDHEIATIANNDEFSVAVDEIQYGRGQGPCLEALRTDAVVAVPDLSREDRWPDYRIHALTYGVRSSLSLPLVIDGESRGALNLYSKTPNGFGTTETAASEAFARQAATALTIVFRNADQLELQDQLREALATRAVIDQAIGIIMGQHACNSSDAFDVLRNASQQRNTKLREVAAELIETVTGEPPRPPRPFTDPR